MQDTDYYTNTRQSIVYKTGLSSHVHIRYITGYPKTAIHLHKITSGNDDCLSNINIHVTVDDWSVAVNIYKQH